MYLILRWIQYIAQVSVFLWTFSPSSHLFALHSALSDLYKMYLSTLNNMIHTLLQWRTFEFECKTWAYFKACFCVFHSGSNIIIVAFFSTLCSLAPVSVHAAFDKAAHYFGMKLIHIPLDKKTMKVDVKVRIQYTQTVCTIWLLFLYAVYYHIVTSL